jgi:uncharacterized protein
MRIPEKFTLPISPASFSTIEPAENIGELNWLPKTCAYRLVAAGRPLPWWHPLISGRAETVVEAGISVLGKVSSEEGVSEDAWESHIWRLPKAVKKAEL